MKYLYLQVYNDVCFILKNHYAPVGQANWCNMTYS